MSGEQPATIILESELQSDRRRITPKVLYHLAARAKRFHMTELRNARREKVRMLFCSIVMGVRFIL